MPDVQPQESKKYNKLAIVSFITLCSVVLYCTFFVIIDVSVFSAYLCTQTGPTILKIRWYWMGVARFLLWFLPLVSIFGFISLQQIKKRREKGQYFALGSTTAIFIGLGLYYIIFFVINSITCGATV